MAAQNLAVRLYPEVLRTLAFGGISGTYAGIGSALLNPARILYLVNATDVLLTFSFDGINDHFVIPSQSYLLFDVTSNMTLTGGALSIAQGQRIYGKGAPTFGTVYLALASVSECSRFTTAGKRLPSRDILRAYRLAVLRLANQLLALR